MTGPKRVLYLEASPYYSFLYAIGNTDLDLAVELTNEPYFTDKDTQPYVGGAPYCDAIGDENDDVEEEEELEKFSLATGNITFVTFANLSFEALEEVEYYYKYIVRGPSWDDRGVACSCQSNWTGEYMEVGDYEYVVHAIARLNPVLAFHANVTGRFEVLGE